MSDNKSEFVREKIKTKPVNKKKLLHKILIAMACGAAGALVFCALTALILPFVLEKRGINLSSAGNQTSQDDIGDDTPDAPVTETETTVPDSEDETEPEDIVDPDLEPGEIPDSIMITDYQDTLLELYQIGEDTLPSTVSITSVQESTDWFNQDVETTGEGIGVIIDANNSEYMILVDLALIKNAKSIKVRFNNGITAEATVKSSDPGTGLAVLSVSASAVPYDRRAEIGKASLGNSTNLARGSLVIALQERGITIGVLTATNREISTPDYNYNILTTDISGGFNEPGILLNAYGQVIGVILPEFQDGQGRLSAISISQLKDSITTMSLGEPIPYLGLTISTVTLDVANTYNLPRGVYVSEVAVDSPAMQAGLQPGDVVTAIDNVTVTSDSSYSAHLLDVRVGDEVTLTVMRLGGNGYNEFTYDIVVGEQ